MKKEMPCRVTDDPSYDYDNYLAENEKKPEVDDIEESKKASG